MFHDRVFALPLDIARLLSEPELDLAMENPVADGQVSLVRDALGVVDSANHVLANGLTEDTGCVAIRENVAGLSGEVEELGVQELHEVHRLLEILAEGATSKSSDLVCDVKGAVGPWRIQLLSELPEKLKPVSRAHLPKLRRKGARELRHDELVERICLHVEVEAELQGQGLGVSLGCEGPDLVERVLGEVLGEDPRRPQQGRKLRTGALVDKAAFQGQY